MDGFDSLGRTKLIMATNRPDTLDPALLRPGRLDRKIEIPLPNEQARLEILKIHAAPVNKGGDIDYEAIVKVCTAIGVIELTKVACPSCPMVSMAPTCETSLQRQACLPLEMIGQSLEICAFDIPSLISREYINQEDLTKAARKVGEAKKHESMFVISTLRLGY